MVLAFFMSLQRVTQVLPVYISIPRKCTFSSWAGEMSAPFTENRVPAGSSLPLSRYYGARRNQQPVFTVNEFGSEDKTHTTLIQLDICSLEFHFECLDILNG